MSGLGFWRYQTQSATASQRRHIGVIIFRGFTLFSPFFFLFSSLHPPNNSDVSLNRVRTTTYTPVTTVVNGISSDRTLAINSNSAFNTNVGGVLTRVEARSAGFCVGNSFTVTVNGVNIGAPNARGINAVVLNSNFQVGAKEEHADDLICLPPFSWSPFHLVFSPLTSFIFHFLGWLSTRICRSHRPPTLTRTDRLPPVPIWPTICAAWHMVLWSFLACKTNRKMP